MCYLKAQSGVQWHYAVSGNGPAVLFIHGWGANRGVWSQQLEYFSDRYKTISVDLPGHGKSTWHTMTLEDIAQDIAGLMRRLAVDTVTVVGSSFGGLVALTCADLFPSMVQRLSLVGSLPKFAQSDDFPFGLAIPRIRKLSAQLDTDYPAILSIFFRSLFTAEERHSDRIKWLLRFRQQDIVPNKDALKHLLVLLEKEDLRGALQKVRMPVQCINGSEDYISSQAFAQHIGELVPACRVDFLQGCGHFPFLTKPQEFNALLEEFLAT